ncbi:MAG: hypothetical protein MHM6MM_000594 [Cercozoa sp. M6MM]
MMWLWILPVLFATKQGQATSSKGQFGFALLSTGKVQNGVELFSALYEHATSKSPAPAVAEPAANANDDLEGIALVKSLDLIVERYEAPGLIAVAHPDYDFAVLVATKRIPRLGEDGWRSFIAELREFIERELREGSLRDFKPRERPREEPFNKTVQLRIKRVAKSPTPAEKSTELMSLSIKQQPTSDNLTLQLALSVDVYGVGLFDLHFKDFLLSLWPHEVVALLATLPIDEKLKASCNKLSLPGAELDAADVCFTLLPEMPDLELTVLDPASKSMSDTQGHLGLQVTLETTLPLTFALSYPPFIKPLLVKAEGLSWIEYDSNTDDGLAVRRFTRLALQHLVSERSEHADLKLIETLPGTSPFRVEVRAVENFQVNIDPTKAEIEYVFCDDTVHVLACTNSICLIILDAALYPHKVGQLLMYQAGELFGDKGAKVATSQLSRHLKPSALWSPKRKVPAVPWSLLSAQLPLPEGEGRIVSMECLKDIVGRVYPHAHVEVSEAAAEQRRVNLKRLLQAVESSKPAPTKPEETPTEQVPKPQPPPQAVPLRTPTRTRELPKLAAPAATPPIPPGDALSDVAADSDRRKLSAKWLLGGGTGIGPDYRNTPIRTLVRYALLYVAVPLTQVLLVLHLRPRPKKARTRPDESVLTGTSAHRETGQHSWSQVCFFSLAVSQNASGECNCDCKERLEDIPSPHSPSTQVATRALATGGFFGGSLFVTEEGTPAGRRRHSHGVLFASGGDNPVNILALLVQPNEAANTLGIDALRRFTVLCDLATLDSTLDQSSTREEGTQVWLVKRMIARSADCNTLTVLVMNADTGETACAKFTSAHHRESRRNHARSIVTTLALKGRADYCALPFAWSASPHLSRRPPVPAFVELSTVRTVSTLAALMELALSKDQGTAAITTELRESALLSLPSVLSWTAQILVALEQLHQRGVVHCDVKPSNIVIGEDMDAQLCDFGSATPLRCLNQAAEPQQQQQQQQQSRQQQQQEDTEATSIAEEEEKLCRELCRLVEARAVDSASRQDRPRRPLPTTPEYAAPAESIHPTKGRRTSRVDVWALGVTLFEALNGCSPFWHVTGCVRTQANSGGSGSSDSRRMQMNRMALQLHVGGLAELLHTDVSTASANASAPDLRWRVADDVRSLVSLCLCHDPDRRPFCRDLLRLPVFDAVRPSLPPPFSSNSG